MNDRGGIVNDRRWAQEIVDLISARPGLSASEIAAEIGCSKGIATTSVRVLWEMGILERHPAGPRKSNCAPYWRWSVAPRFQP